MYKFSPHKQPCAIAFVNCFFLTNVSIRWLGFPNVVNSVLLSDLLTLTYGHLSVEK